MFSRSVVFFACSFFSYFIKSHKWNNRRSSLWWFCFNLHSFKRKSFFSLVRIFDILNKNEKTKQSTALGKKKNLQFIITSTYLQTVSFFLFLYFIYLKKTNFFFVKKWLLIVYSCINFSHLWIKTWTWIHVDSWIDAMNRYWN
jgi:hypothetical protein